MSNIQIRRRDRSGPDEDNALWQLRIRIDGKDYYRHVRGALAAAREAAARWAAELDGQAPSYTASMTFAAFAETWISRHLPTLANQTAVGYRTTIGRYLLPAIGSRRLGRITAADGLRLQDRMLRAKLSPTTIEHALRLGRAILDEAQRFSAIPANPWINVRQGQRRLPRHETLDPARFHELLDADRDTIQEILILALLGGMRLGEILALRWRDIAGDFASLEVNGSIETVAGLPVRKDPKTEAGRRRIGLPAAAAHMLRERNLRQGRPNGERPVFHGRDGRWRKPSATSHRARKRLQAQGWAQSIHGLRHAHATALLSAGVSPQTVAHRLGHTDVSVTLSVYGHTLPGDDPRAVAVLDRAIVTAA